MIRTRLTATAIAAFGAILMSAGTASAVTPAPAPNLIQPEAPTIQARMMRHRLMKHRTMRRGGRGTISTKLGAKTR